MRHHLAVLFFISFAIIAAIHHLPPSTVAREAVLPPVNPPIDEPILSHPHASPHDTLAFCYAGGGCGASAGGGGD